jgi:hypothetical protein
VCARGAEDPGITAEQVYDEFISEHYGEKAVPEVKEAFRNAFDIVSSSFYTLGNNLANHSRIDFDPYASSFARHVSGKWFDPPISYVAHGVNREFHSWRDVINRVAPPHLKATRGGQWNEVPWVWQNNWLQPGEAMDEEYLRYIVTEKNYGVALAEDSAQHIENARAVLKPADYDQLRHHFQHTLLTVRIRRATASAYYGFRVWCRGGEFQTPYVRDVVQNSLNEIKEVAALMRAYPVKPATGQWDWKRDPNDAEQYFNWIVNGWPAQTRNQSNPYGGMKFPYVEPQGN